MELESCILRPGEAANYLSKSISTLARWRVEGHGPPYIQLGVKAIGYRRKDIDDWLQGQIKYSTSG